MKADEFREMNVEVAREHVNRHGLKLLIKKTGEFYDNFFRYGLWRPDFPEKLRILTDAGLDLNKPICGGRREKEFPIFVVISQRDRHTAPAITALASCGANINVQNVEGKTPIMVASTGRWTYYRDLSKPSIVKTLIKAGADLSLKDNKGNLVTDLADSKALPILIAAGAPVNKKSQHALSTAIWAEDINLTRILLQKGLQLKLDDSNINLKFAFLETVAQTAPELFVEGFSLEDSEQHPTDKKTVKAYKALLELCAIEPHKNPAKVANEDALPASLRSGAWPPIKSEATTYLEATSVATSDPHFCFPGDIKKPYDERFAKIDLLLRNTIEFSKLMNEIDTCLNKIEKYDVLECSRIFRLESYEQRHGRTFIRGLGQIESYYDRINACMSKIKSVSSVFSNFCAISRCRFDSVYDAKAVTSFSKRDLENFRRLPSRRDFIRYAMKRDSYHIFEFEADLGIFGKRKYISCYENSRAAYGDEFKDLVRTLTQFEEFLNDALDLPMLYKFTNLSSDYVKYHCNDYLASSPRLNDREPLIDLIETDIGPDATEFLVAQAKSGSSAALWTLSFLNSPDIARFMLDNLSLVHNKKFALAWLNRFPMTAAQGLLQCAFGSSITDHSLAKAALRLMSLKGKRELIIDCALKFGPEAQAMAIEFLGYDSRADFLPKKMPKLPTYFIACAHSAPVLKETGESLPAHAVETLIRMMLVSTCHLQNSALQDVIEACDRHSLAEFALSTFEMWSRNGAKKDGIGFLHALAYFGDNRAAVLLSKTYRHAPPTVATPVIEVLAAMGSNTAIAGIQAIARTSLNEKSREIAQEVLEDVARDRGLTAAMLEDLAVPDLGLGSDGQIPLDFGPRRFVAKVDFMLAPILIAEDGNVLKALPKALKSDDASKATAATARWKEFTASLKSQGEDQRKRFEQAMLSRREWDGGTFKELVANHPLLAQMVRSLVWAKMKDQTIDTTFRVDAGGRLVTADGAELSLVDEARVTIPHPLLLGEAIAAWVNIFAENQLPQPFPQLARKWFANNADTDALIRARDGTKVPLGSLRGLKAKDWVFDEGGAGMIWSIFKSVDGGRASIDVEPGWSISGFDYEDFGGDQTVKMEVYGSDPITYSELVRELLSLPIAEG